MNWPPRMPPRHQRPKVELYGDCLFVALRTAQMIEEKVDFGETTCSSDALSGDGAAWRSLYYAACAPLRGYSAPAAQGPAFALYAILDFVVDNYFPILTAWKTRWRPGRTVFQGDFDQDDLGGCTSPNVI